MYKTKIIWIILFNLFTKYVIFFKNSKKFKNKKIFFNKNKKPFFIFILFICCVFLNGVKFNNNYINIHNGINLQNVYLHTYELFY